MRNIFATCAACLGLLLTLTFLNADNLPSSSVMRGYSGQLIYNATATISSSATTTGVIDMKGFSLAGILFPATFTGATVSFTASIDGTNFFVVKSTTSGTTLSYTVTQATFSAINPVDFYGIRYLKIVSASTESSARTLTLALKGI